MSRYWWRAAAVGAVLSTFVVGCAEERDPINRVQANALAKSFFVGEDLLGPHDDPEFLSQATLIDAPYGVSQGYLFPSTFSQAPSRIKWQVTEDLLLGRLTYELIDDADGRGVGAASTDGQIVVAYRVSSHFDIRRSYNPSTGEELNVIEENSSDRPWYEREYFRVDWSENLQTDSYDFDTLSLMGVYGGVHYSSLAYYVNDPSDKDAPYFDVDGGYFDVTNKAFATPQVLDLSSLGWGIEEFPACYLPDEFSGGTYPEANCNPSELTIRQAFRRVVDTDYEPAHWDGWKFQGYGAFYQERLGFARNYGIVDDRWYRFISRYNIWERSHYYDDAASMTGPVECFTPETTPYGADPKRDDDANGTDDECEAVTGMTGVAGSQCDHFSQKCTLPYRLRTPKPVSWYFTTGSNHEYWDGTLWATHNWDVAFRKAVQVARYSECMSTDPAADPAVCGADWPVYHGQMDDNLEAMQLAREVDDCRHGLSYPEYGAINSSARESACVALADTVAAARSGDGTRPFDYGVIALAKMPEMIVLCHSPVEANDPPACGPDHERLPADITAEMCTQAENERDGTMLPICRSARFARRGDLRYHLINVFWEPHTPSPWGIYTDAHDPLTGETFSAAVNVWTYINDLWSQLVVDRTRFIKGELTAEDVTEAEYVTNYAEAIGAAQRGGVMGQFKREDVLKRAASMGGISTDELSTMIENAPEQLKAQAKQFKTRVKDFRFSMDAPSTMSPIYDARRRLAVGTETEASLMNPMIQKLGGVQGMPLEGSIMDYASPLRGLHPGVSRKMRQFKEQALARHGACIMHEAPAPLALADFGAVLEQKFANMCVGREDLDDVCSNRAEFNDFAGRQVCGPMREACAIGPTDPGCTCDDTDGDNAISEIELDACCSRDVDPWHAGLCVERQQPDPENCLKYNTFSPDDGVAAQMIRAERMRQYVAQRAHMAVIVHEMGHSIGQRHNFVSSADAWAYRPQYWQLRTKDGQVRKRCGCNEFTPPHERECETYVADGEECVGPRYFDPVTENEGQNLIWTWQQSSVMDYAGDYTQDMLGLAVWDFAAATMFYGENVAVFDDPSYAVGQPRAGGMLAKMDNFGGILGLQPSYAGEDIHYTELNNVYDLIYDCQPVNVDSYRPAAWNDAKNGLWHPVIDGLIVSVDGQYTKCRQQKVDYVPWDRLHIPTGNELFNVSYYRAGGGVDHRGRVRVPYGFATDGWADLGNVSVYRHDNGADVYEIFNWLATQGEVHHIFDNYRRGRLTFSVRSAANRTLGRYHEKIRDGAKGLGLMANIYRDFSAENNWTYDDGYWSFLLGYFFPDNTLASSLVFDHFVKAYSRPEAGPHYVDDYILDSNIKVMRSDEDSYKGVTNVVALIPNGATGKWGRSVASAGKLLENRLCEDCGEYDRDFTMNAGSYYDKVNTPYLMTESVDNFISDSRGDFLDGRYRAVSLADLYPDGYRRWMGQMLTLDEELKGTRMAASDADGTPLVDADKYPSWPLGWPSFWPDTPEICFPAEGTTICGAPGLDSTDFDPRMPDYTVAVDSQVDWEVQKFLINWTMLYLPENEKQKWINQLRIWELGLDADPEFQNRIEFHDPYGKVFVALSYGKEEIFGRTVEKGIAARVLEFANEMLNLAYVVDCDVVANPHLDPDGDGVANWCEPVIDPTTGTPQVAYQEGMVFVDASGAFVTYNGTGCGENPVSGLLEQTDCPCSANRACVMLEKYATIPYYMRQTMAAYGLIDPEQRGVYDY